MTAVIGQQNVLEEMPPTNVRLDVTLGEPHQVGTGGRKDSRREWHNLVG